MMCVPFGSAVQTEYDMQFVGIIKPRYHIKHRVFYIINQLISDKSAYFK